ncbi:DUF2905 domain-containing protein [Promineifilum sp.]|uniref:DUF2905 domain-containing protein n=1 Tax=Promineifilum sp. TaxID=2664178 RepID=UPI0035B10D1E
MTEFGRLLLIIGAIVAFAGLVLLVAGRFFPWLGNLPGDFRFEGENYRVYFPLATMILISVVGTIVLNLLIRFFRR